MMKHSLNKTKDRYYKDYNLLKIIYDTFLEVHINYIYRYIYI